MKKILLNTLMLIGCLFVATSCFDDKGNYDYEPIPEITATGFPEQITVVQKADLIEVSPSFKSSSEGNIDENPNFEFGCSLYIMTGSLPDGSRGFDINPEKTRTVSYLPEVDEGDYLLWYTVTDKRDGTTTNFKVPVKVTSATYEGWMVLCNDGADKRMRMDLVSVISSDRKVAVHDLWGDLDIHNAKHLVYDPWPNYAKGDFIYAVTEEGAYNVNAYDLRFQNIAVEQTEFIMAPKTEKVVAMGQMYLYGGLLAITNEGNVYNKGTSSGAAYEDPVNRFKADGPLTFKAAPFIGVVKTRPMSYYEQVALLYDQEGKRFMTWSGFSKTICSELKDEDAQVASFTTGKDMVAMVSTQYSSSTIYSVLQDAANNRSLYGISLSGGKAKMTQYHELSHLAGFNTAKCYAFHSQYPYMFFDNGNTVQCYHMTNKNFTSPLTLPGEDITMMKFCLFNRARTALSDKSDEFFAQQYYLVVGSYKQGAQENGGVLRYYSVDYTTGALTLVEQYDGFGEIVDVMYRER